MSTKRDSMGLCTRGRVTELLTCPGFTVAMGGISGLLRRFSVMKNKYGPLGHLLPSVMYTLAIPVINYRQGASISNASSPFVGPQGFIVEYLVRILNH